MNIKIYFEDKLIIIGNQEDTDFEMGEVTEFDSNKNKLMKILLKFFSSTKKSLLIIGEKHLVLKWLESNFYSIEAAGGLINQNNKYLFIYRLNHWDLPKGKIDEGETIEETAVRECEEECGIRKLTIVKGLSSTYHIYPYKESYALKTTYWFSMSTDFKGKLTPQIEENITDIKWFNKQEIQKVVCNNTYETIKDVVKEALNISCQPIPGKT
ncbi:MAG: NUDIX hydrolase [Bacteroidia bacterium]